MAYMGEKKKKTGYRYMYDWFTLLYTWNEHSVVNQLYSNKNFLKKKERTIKNQNQHPYTRPPESIIREFESGFPAVHGPCPPTPLS